MPAGYSANISQSRVVNTAALTAGRDIASSISSSNKIFHTSPCRQADLTEIRDTNFFTTDRYYVSKTGITIAFLRISCVKKKINLTRIRTLCLARYFNRMYKMIWINKLLSWLDRVIKLTNNTNNKWCVNYSPAVPLSTNASSLRTGFPSLLFTLLFLHSTRTTFAKVHSRYDRMCINQQHTIITLHLASHFRCW